MTALNSSPLFEKLCDDDDDRTTPDFSEFVDLNGDGLPDEWSPSTPHRSTEPKALLIAAAEDILGKRRKIVENTGKTIDDNSNLAITAGLGMSFLSGGVLAPLGLCLSAVGLAAKYINHRMTSKGLKVFEEAKNALDICNDLEAIHQHKSDALAKLHKTADHIKYWEKARNVSLVAFKFLIVEVLPPASYIVTAFEGKEAVTDYHDNRPSSQTFEENICNLSRHLGFEVEEVPKNQKLHSLLSFFNRSAKP